MRFNGTDDNVPTRLKVADVLVNYGKDVSFSRSGLIRSPFRDERTPSFHILPEGYGWVDFGDGSKGGVIDLVMRLENCDRSGALKRIVEIKHGGRVYAPSRSRSSNRPCKPSAPAFKVVSSTPFTGRSLIGYAAGRGISEDVLQKYCSEITVRIRNGNRPLSYIGFPNSGDGYVLRNERPGRDGKRCTCSAPTFLSSTGEQTATATSGCLVVFEGLFDFLSFIERGRAERGLEPGCDVCVLNSVTNVGKAIPFIREHTRADLYLDNDNAGHKAFEDIRESSPGVSVHDHSVEYGGYGDYNEFHQENRS